MHFQAPSEFSESTDTRRPHRAVGPPLRFGLAVGLLWMSTAVVPAYAHSEGEDLDVIVVYGRALQKVGTAKTASEGTVGYQDFEDRPLSRSGELVEVIPGAVATQHSGEGKANQFFLRGFNLDHGTDFSAQVDGVPVNLRTHGHGQGYLDLNFVIPELVERVDYRKGPYSAQDGDFSTAGSARYSTRDRLDNNFIDLTAGEFDYLRGVVGISESLSENTDLLLGGEIHQYDGPWALEQDLKKYNGLAKLVHDTMRSHFELTATAYDSEWTATDQVPTRAIETGLIDRFGFIDDDLGGDTQRFSLSLQTEHLAGDGSLTNTNLYAVDYSFNLFSNFTYFAEDPINGDEFEQVDERRYYGGGVEHIRKLTPRLEGRVGLDMRYDDIAEVGLFKTADRARLSTIRRDAVKQFSTALWGELEYALTDTLRVTGGVRGDFYETNVEALSEPENGGKDQDGFLSPSLGLAWQVRPEIEFYANYGQGFHSNDARGTTISVDPVTNSPVDTVPLLVKSKGEEIGMRFEKGDVRFSVSAFHLSLDSELVFVGDAGTTEPNSASERWGAEANLFWLPTDWLVLDVSGAHTDASFSDVGPDDKIPGAVETVFAAGALAKFDRVAVGARLRHFGSAPLIEDDSVRSDATTLVNLSAQYELGDVTFGLELLNAFDSRDADISYFFGSRLSSESAPVEDIHIHPVEPRQVRASLRYNF